MPENYRKTVWTTIFYTLLILIVVFALFVMLMFFVFTKNLADFMYSVGFDNMASCLYYRVYEKTDNVMYCYKALNIKISIEDHNCVVKYYDAFVIDEEYSEFMELLKENNENLNVGILEKSTLLNDRNYLVNNYVKSLIKIDEKDKAFNVALEEFKGYESFEITNQGVFAFGDFIVNEEWNKFDKNYNGFTNKLYQEIQVYFQNIVSEFENNKTADTNIEKAYLMALGNRAITVGQSINLIYNGLNLMPDKIVENNETMIAINNTLKGLL